MLQRAEVDPSDLLPSKRTNFAIAWVLPSCVWRLMNWSYENGGVCVARNRGIARATGEFIAFLDADDLWTPDKLELQVSALKEHPEAGVAYSWTYFMDVDEQGEGSSFLPSPSYAFAGNVYKRLLVSDFVHSGSNTLVRRQAIESVGGFDPACAGCADWDYWLRLSAHWSFVVVPKHQIFYRRSAGCMSSNVEVMRKEALIAIENAYRAAPPELQYLKSHTLANLHKYCSGLYLQHSSDYQSIQQAGQDLWAAICMRPQDLREQTVQKLLIKFMLKRIFSPRVVSYLFQWIRKPLGMPTPRLEP
jgi:glycosyltransferase involved in cell wall biosynthesis